MAVKKSAKLDKYDANAKCPKCGYVDEEKYPKLGYCDGTNCYRHGEDGLDHTDTEHLHHQCGLCGYERLVSPLDSGENDG